MIHTEKMTATMEGDFVLFLTGMRFNQPWKVHQWLPVVLSMGHGRRSCAGQGPTRKRCGAPKPSSAITVNIKNHFAASACTPSSFQELDHV